MLWSAKGDAHFLFLNCCERSRHVLFQSVVHKMGRLLEGKALQEAENSCLVTLCV